jgi:hypothetical protein
MDYCYERDDQDKPRGNTYQDALHHERKIVINGKETRPRLKGWAEDFSKILRSIRRLNDKRGIFKVGNHGILDVPVVEFEELEKSYGIN